MKILDYIFAARPMLLLPVWSIYIISMHNHHQLSGKSVQVSDFIMLAVLSIVAGGAYYINQIFDYKSDLVNDKIGFLQKGFLTQKQLLTGYIVTLLISFFASLYFTPLSMMLISLLIVLGYLYSAKPCRLKDRLILGLFANAFGYGFIVPLTVMPEMDMHNVGLLGWDGPFYFTFAVGGVYLLTTIPDRKGDMLTGKKTAAVLFPDWVVKVIALIFMVVSGCFAWESEFMILFFISVISTVFVILTLFIKSENLLLAVIKTPILLLTLLASYYQPFYLLFIVALVAATRIYYKRRFNLKYPKMA